MMSLLLQVTIISLIFLEDLPKNGEPSSLNIDKNIIFSSFFRAYKKTILENELSKLELSKSNSKVKGAISALSKGGPSVPAKGQAGPGGQGAQPSNDVHHHKNPIL
jgi:hypothetical protein